MSREREQQENLHEGFDVSSLETELERERYRSRYRSVLQSTIFTLITVAAAAVLVATLWMPVLQLYGNTMSPSLEAEDVVVCLKSGNFKQGDVVAFYFNNKILVKRVIGVAGDVVEIDGLGNVSVNGVQMEEPYVTEKALGECNIKMPYTVPTDRLFVMGDNRVESVDSRNMTLGCVESGQVIGKLLVRVWPIEKIGLIN